MMLRLKEQFDAQQLDEVIGRDKLLILFTCRSNAGPAGMPANDKPIEAFVEKTLVQIPICVQLISYWRRRCGSLSVL